jgi:hypothetical protein
MRQGGATVGVAGDIAQALDLLVEWGLLFQEGARERP